MEKIVKTLNENGVILDEAGGYGASIRNIIFEEMGELIQAISKMERSDLRLNDLYIRKAMELNKEKRDEIRPKIEEVRELIETEFKPNLAEEIADVIIALYWVIKKYKVKESDIVEWLEFKCDRMDTKIGEGDFY